MKILAIRGANLASLEGDFDLRFDEGPLAHAGVFAICGPTGAGKSTLLDAMCLALFDTAPRLDGGGRGRVGVDEGERLTQKDPRSLLRKGASDGFAEVEFIGVDGRRYASRWEVRRARGAAEGKLQPVRMALRDIDEEWSESGRKTDVKTAIEERLGLTFDQFRRSVLLAQGDFAAFLDADPRERAELFERMTGTEIYSAISREAHRRAAAERERLSLLSTRLEAIGALDAEERAALEGRASQLGRRVREDELAALDAAAAVRWHHHLGALRAEEAEAREEKAALDAQLELVETQREQLREIERAAPAREALARAEVAERAVLERRAVWDAASERAADAVAEARRADGLADEAERARAQLETAVERAQSTLERCRVLDERLATVARELSVAQRAAADAEAAQHTLEGLTSARRVALEETRASLAKVRGELAAASAHAALERDGERAVARLRRLSVVESELRAASAEVESRDARAAAADAERAAAEGALAGRRLRTAELEADYREARAESRRAPPEALESVRVEWLGQRTALERLMGLADRAESSREARRRHQSLALECAASAERAAAEERRADAERAAAALRIDECAGQRDRLRARLDLSDHRAELVDGEPCPLCGALEHPLAQESLGSELLAEIDERLSALEAQRSEADRRSAEARREAAAERSAEARAEAESALHAEAFERARVEYAATAEGLAEGLAEGAATSASWPRRLPAAPESSPEDEGRDWGPLFAMARVQEGGALLGEGAREALRLACDEASAALEDLAGQVEERRARVRTVVALRDAGESARAEEERAARVARAAAEVLDARRAEAARHRQVAERLEAEEASLRAELAPALAGFEQPWVAGEGLLERVCATLATIAAHREALAACEVAERSGAPELAALEARLASAEERRAEAAQALEVRRAEGAQLELEAVGARAELAEGLPPEVLPPERLSPEVLPPEEGDTWQAGDAEDLASRLRAAIATARQRARAERDAAQRAAVEEARAISRLDAASLAAEDAERSRRLSLDVLHAVLEPIGLDEESARALFSREASELDAWRKEIARLDRVRRELQAVVHERQRKRELHEAAEPPRLDEAAATAAQAETEARLGSTRELFHSVRARLDRDDTDRTRAGETRKGLEAQRKRLAVWDTLSDVIGSASGNKLRVFVQSLTLELLLGHANVQLRQLAPRYSLARVPGEDLALQVVDHEMGDEVRALSSLSGGESFLVALGLALGLASLTSESARIDSLFIDEGFGALDPESLELVLATLDALQASGRQVGLISHVPAIAERFEARVSVVPSGPATSSVQLAGP